jgi:hypothetical protein
MIAPGKKKAVVKPVNVAPAAASAPVAATTPVESAPAVTDAAAD